MVRINSLLSTAVLLAPCVAGCSKPASTPAAPSAEKSATPPAATAHEHTHGAGPNGGVVFDLGSHHAEFTVDHNKHECTVLILASDEKTPAAIAAKDLVLNTKETKTAEGKVVPPMTVTLSAKDATDGKASTYVGTDEGIGNVADFGGTISGEIEGKPAAGEFQE